LRQLPPDPETGPQAIDLHLAARTALIPLGDTAAIVAHMQAAEALAERLGDTRRQGRIAAYWTRGRARAGQHDEAVRSGQRALALIHDDPALRMTAQLYLSYAYHDLGDYQQALAVLHDALGSVDALPAHARLGAALPAVTLRHSLTRTLAELGRFDDGVRHGQEAVHLADAAGHPFSLVQACRSLGCLHLARGSVARALPLLERALAVCRDADLPYSVPYTISALGCAYARAGRPADALACLDEARPLAAARQADSGYATWLVLLADGYLSVGHHATAAALAREALRTARERRERGVQAHALGLLGRLAGQEAQPDVATATACHREAIALAEELGMRPVLAHGASGLGLLHVRLGQRREATTALARAADLYQSMGMTSWLAAAETTD
jgi:tetratricopeptide (TPR) repeat protein